MLVVIDGDGAAAAAILRLDERWRARWERERGGRE